MFILPIKESYISDWGSWETLREIIQNAKDEEDQHGHLMQLSYERGWLRVANHGADLERKALLLGETSKSNREDLRGRFGEGLDLALLAGVRAGYDMRVYTCTEIWTPAIEHVEKFDARVLVVRTALRKTKGSGVEIRIKMPLRDWLDARKLFRFLVDDPEEYQVAVNAGTILLHPDRRGQIYVKGIYTTTVSSLHYGYDLKHIRLDRDRRMVDSWDLRWELADILREGVQQDPAKLSHPVYGMLKHKTEDVQSMVYHSSEALAEAMVACFIEEHGDKAVPVESIAESQSLEHFGMRGAIVSDSLRKILEQKVKSAAEIRRELTQIATIEYSWQDLSDDERTHLLRAVQLITDATGAMRDRCELPPLLDRLVVADFHNTAVRGTCDGRGAVKIARRLLGDLKKTLRVLIHEEAHALSLSSDGSKDHIDALQDIWMAVHFGTT